MTSSRLRELSRLASPAPWVVVDPDAPGGGEIHGPPEPDGENTASSEFVAYADNPKDSALVVALRNDAEKYADLRDAVKAVREAFNAPWHSVPDMERVRHDALNKAFAALAALGGEE